MGYTILARYYDGFIILYMILVFDINKVFGWSYNPYSIYITDYAISIGSYLAKYQIIECVLNLNYYPIELNADYPLSFYEFSMCKNEWKST